MLFVRLQDDCSEGWLSSGLILEIQSWRVLYISYDIAGHRGSQHIDVGAIETRVSPGSE